MGLTKRWKEFGEHRMWTRRMVPRFSWQESDRSKEVVACLYVSFQWKCVCGCCVARRTESAVYEVTASWLQSWTSAVRAAGQAWSSTNRIPGLPAVPCWVGWRGLRPSRRFPLYSVLLTSDHTWHLFTGISGSFLRQYSNTVHNVPKQVRSGSAPLRTQTSSSWQSLHRPGYNLKTQTTLPSVPSLVLPVLTLGPSFPSLRSASGFLITVATSAIR